MTWNRVTRTNGAGPVTSYIMETLDIMTNPGNTWAPTTPGPRQRASTPDPHYFRPIHSVKRSHYCRPHEVSTRCVARIAT